MRHSGETPQKLETPFDAAIVEDLLRQLDKMVRAHQLYPSHNVTYRKTLENLRSAFGAVWEKTGSICLQVTDTQFTWSDVAVLEEPEKVSDSLPWTFFKDGVRELSFSNGFEGDELDRLLEIIPLVRRARDDEDDMLTLLWEQEFQFLAYRFLDNTTGEGVPLDPSATPGRWPVSSAGTREDPRAAVAEVKRRLAEGGGASGLLDKALSPPSPAETPASARPSAAASAMGYLTREIEREYAADLRAAVLDVLLDIFELQEDPLVRQEVAQYLDGLALQLLSGLKFGNVTHLLRECAVALERSPSLSSEMRERLEHLSDRVSDPVVLAPLLEAMDQAEAPPSSDELAGFLDRLGPRALGTLFIWSAQSKHVLLRPLLSSAADRLAQSSTDELVKLIASSDQREALEAAKRTGHLHLEAAVPALGRLLGSTEDDLRAAALAALIEIATPRAMHGVERALEDSNRGIRMTALKVLAASAQKAALPRVTEMVTGREVRDFDHNERIALFELYGTICGDAGIPWLESQLIGPRGFFKRKSDPEMRACAALALGRVGMAAAREVLTRALSEKDPLIRKAVSRALGSATS